MTSKNTLPQIGTVPHRRLKKPPTPKRVLERSFFKVPLMIDDNFRQRVTKRVIQKHSEPAPKRKTKSPVSYSNTLPDKRKLADFLLNLPSLNSPRKPPDKNSSQFLSHSPISQQKLLNIKRNFRESFTNSYFKQRSSFELDHDSFIKTSKISLLRKASKHQMSNGELEIKETYHKIIGQLASSKIEETEHIRYNRKESFSNPVLLKKDYRKPIFSMLRKKF